MNLEEKYEKLRLKLFNLKMKQKLLSLNLNKKEYLENEKNILKVKKEIASVIFKLKNKMKIGGR